MDGHRTSSIAVILNAGSGSSGSEDLGTMVAERFRSRGIEAEVHTCSPGENIHLYARGALRRGCTTIVAGGGDGTVSAVAAVLAGTDALLGVLPLGTLNHFAKDAGIPLDLDEAVAAIVEGHNRVVDLGEVNGRTFINNSSLGLYPKIVRHREAQQRLGRSKWWAFFKGILTVLGRYSFLEVQVSSDQGQIVRSTPFVFIGNNEYEIHGLSIGTRARIDTGRLSVYLTRRVGRFDLLCLVVRGLAGRLRDAEDFDTLSTDQLEVHVRGRTVRVALDGEVVLMESPLRYRCRSGAIRVIVKKSG